MIFELRLYIISVPRELNPSIYEASS